MAARTGTPQYAGAVLSASLGSAPPMVGRPRARPPKRRRLAAVLVILVTLSVALLAARGLLPYPQLPALEKFSLRPKESAAASAFGSSAARRLGLRPVSVEDVAGAARALAGPLLHAAERGVLPAQLLAERAEATLLRPLVERLTAASVPPPARLATALRRTCRRVGSVVAAAAGATHASASSQLALVPACPELRVLEAESRPRLQTLPGGSSDERRGEAPRGILLVSRGLLLAASARELEALFAREIALLLARVPVAPEAWLLRPALRPLLPAPAAPLAAAIGGAAAEEEAVTAQGVLGDLLWLFGKQAIEIARAYYGIRWLAARSAELPSEVRGPVLWLEETATELVPLPLGDAAEVLAAFDVAGPVGARAVAKRRFGREDYQLRRYWDIGTLAWRAGLYSGGGKRSLRSTFNSARRAMRIVARLGPERVESVLSFAVTLRQPRRAWWPSRRKRFFRGEPEKKRRPPLSPLLAIQALAAWRRVAELRADRTAVKVVGAVEPVAGALVLLHGSSADLRRRARGELGGLLDDARASYPPRARWAAWWAACARAPWRPPALRPALQLRLAELADLAAEAE